MKLGFYISMGIAITGLAVGFVLLYDIQQEKEIESIWMQKIPTQCNDVWEEEYNEFYEINPEMQNATKEELKEIVEDIIKNHYEKQGINILDLSLEINAYEGIRCEACNCLGWDKLSIKIPKSELKLISESEGWEPKG
ncbi:MAG: hypothetical protein IIA19_03705 [Thaumarchaeota archaeon]|nr:hypothetical protein [Nitrososphaerota archaeon]